MKKTGFSIIACVVMCLSQANAEYLDRTFVVRDKRKLDCDSLSVRAYIIKQFTQMLQRANRNYGLEDIEIIPKYRGRMASVCIYKTFYSDGEENVIAAWDYRNSVGDVTFYVKADYEYDPNDDKGDY